MQKLDNKAYRKYYMGIILVLAIVVLATIINIKINQPKVPIMETAEQVEEYVQQNVTRNLQNMEERDRMEYYVSIFLEHVENGEYQKAYDLLYEEFKATYFPTLEDFEEYIPTLFSEMNEIEHSNIERNGDIYVLWLSITDTVNGKPGTARKINIVIREKDYNDFELSFSVI